jgi:hypothetical protein
MSPPKSLNPLFIEKDLPNPQLRPPLLLIHITLIIAIMPMPAVAPLALRFLSRMARPAFLILIVLVFRGLALVVADDDRVVARVAVCGSTALAVYAVVS